MASKITTTTFEKVVSAVEAEISRRSNPNNPQRDSKPPPEKSSNYAARGSRGRGRGGSSRGFRGRRAGSLHVKTCPFYTTVESQGISSVYVEVVLQMKIVTESISLNEEDNQAMEEEVKAHVLDPKEETQARRIISSIKLQDTIRTTTGTNKILKMSTKTATTIPMVQTRLDEYHLMSRENISMQM